MPLVTDSIRSLAHALIVAAILVAALVLGREILLPLALATVFAFILSPIVGRLTRTGLHRGPASAFVVVITAIAISGLAAAFSAQLVSLTADFSQYKENIVAKVRFLSGSNASTGVLSRATATMDALEEDLKTVFGKGKPTAGAPAEKQVVVAPSPTGASPVMERLALVGQPLALAGLTLLFTIFLTTQYNDLRDRVIRIAGTDNISLTASALSEAGERLSHLFTMQALMNLGFGAFVGIALTIIGVPNPLLWGIATAILRFAPYIGSMLAAVPPTILAAGVDPGWSMTLATMGVFVIGEPIIGNVIEPLVLGRSAGLSPLAVLVSASFWTLIWGPVGLVLAVPLTTVIVILGEYIPKLEFISVLLGDEPALAAEEEFYNRLLAGDAIAALPQIEAVEAQQQLAAAGDTFVLPALKLASRDHRLQRIDELQIKELRATVDEVLDLMDAKPAASPEIAAEDTPVIVLPARGPIDEIAAHYVGRVLQHASDAKVMTIDTSSGLLALATAKANANGACPSMIVITAVGGLNPAYLKLIHGRALREFPNTRLLTVSLTSPLTEPRAAAGHAHPAASSNSLRDIAALVASRTPSRGPAEDGAARAA